MSVAVSDPESFSSGEVVALLGSSGVALGSSGVLMPPDESTFWARNGFCWISKVFPATGGIALIGLAWLGGCCDPEIGWTA